MYRVRHSVSAAPQPQIPLPQNATPTGPSRGQALSHTPGPGAVVPGTEAFHASLPQGIATVATADGLTPAESSFPFQAYPTQLQAPRTLHTPTAAPPQSWQAPNGIAPEQTQAHLSSQAAAQMMPRGTFREDAWDGTYQQTAPSNTSSMVSASAPSYEYRGFREDQAGWVPGSNEYYEQPVRKNIMTMYHGESSY